MLLKRAMLVLHKYTVSGVEEDDFIWGAHAKNMADRPRGHGKGEEVGCAPSCAKCGSNCFKHSLNLVEYRVTYIKFQIKFFSFLQLNATFAILQARIINTELEFFFFFFFFFFWGGGGGGGVH